MEIFLSNLNFFRPFSLLLVVAVMMIPILTTSWKPKIFFDILFVIFTAFALFCWRAPSLLLNTQINIDESLIISEAICFLHNPVPWLSADTTTTGPLNTWIHMWTCFFGEIPTYTSMRWTTIFLIGITIYSLKKISSEVISYHFSYVSVLPSLLLYLLSTDQDSVHASSEYFPAALIAVAFSLAFPIWSGASSSWRCALVGFLLGAVPYAKLQAAPIAFVLGLTLLIKLLAANNTRRFWLSGALLIGAFGCSFVIISVVFLGGALQEMWIRYFAQNLVYSAPLQIQVPSFEIFRQLLKLNSQFTIYLAWIIGLVFSSFMIIILNKSNYPIFEKSVQKCPVKKNQVKDVTLISGSPYLNNLPLVEGSNKLQALTSFEKLLLITFSLIWLFSCYYSMVKSGFIFPHYLTLIIFPLSILSLFVLSFFQRSGFAILIIPSICLGSVPPMVHWCVMDDPYKDYIKAIHSGSDFRDELSHFISEQLAPGETLGIWGSSPKYYAETKTRSATRDVLAHFQILHKNPHADHYKKVFLEDLKANKPKIFIDTASDINKLHNFVPMNQRRFTSYAPLREYIETYYYKIAEFPRPNQEPYLVYRLKSSDN